MDELDKQQIAILQKAFDSFAQGKGYITPEMVGTILRVMGQAFNEQTLRELIAEVDQDGSGQIEFAEFVILASKFIVEEDEEALQKELKEAFRLYDKEGNGYIPTSCLKEILHELDDQLTNDDLEGIINEIDEDGSGTVDFNVHHSDPLRLDIVIQGEQHIYVRAASPTERQQWLVALGSAKAQGLVTRSKRSTELATTPDDVKAKKSELRLYCDLLMQQVHSIKEAATEDPQPDVNKLDECTSLLSATCDTFIKTLDECVKIANASPSYAISTPPPIPSLPVPNANSVCKSGKIKSIIHSNSH